MMKRALLLTSIIFLLSSAAAAQTAEAPKFLPEEVTGQELRDLAGRTFRLSDLRGRVYVINLWATWCGPCRLEIPGFNKIYEDYRARGVEFVGLTAEDPEESAEQVSEFVGEFKMNYRVGWIDRETARKLGAWNAPPSTRSGYPIPQTFVVAADGRVVLRLRGYNPRVPEMVRAGVQKALELSPSSPTETSRPPRT